ncbi:MAG: PH domain-containing protein [Polyangiales bacterium]
MADVAAFLPVEPVPAVHPQLGRILSEHRGRPFSGGVWFYFTGLFLVGAFYQLALGVSAWLDGLVDGMTFLSSLLLFALAAAGAARCVWLWRQTLGIYEGGFALHRLTGRRVVPWSEVAGALARRETDQTGTRFVIEIELRDGGTVVLTDALTGIEPQAALFQDRGGFRG